MSHDAAANRPVRESSRRRIRFQARMEDLEGRVLMSVAHPYRAPHVQVRVVHPPKAHPRVVRRPLLRLGRVQAPTITIPVNVQTTVAGSTNTYATTPSTSTSQTPATTT